MPFQQGSVRTAYLCSTGQRQLELTQWLGQKASEVSLLLMPAVLIDWHQRCQSGFQPECLYLVSPCGYWTFSLWLGSKNDHPPRECQADIILLLWSNLRNHSECHVCYNHKHPQIQVEGNRPCFSVRRKKECQGNSVRRVYEVEGINAKKFLKYSQPKLSNT